MAVIGQVNQEMKIRLLDTKENNQPIDLEVEMLLGKPPKMLRDVKTLKPIVYEFDHRAAEISDAIERVLKLPTVADKTFLITIGDRTVTGLVHRDQMVGPYQVPVADAAVTIAGYQTNHGEVMALGEKTPAALLNPPASGRLAVAEALTNLFSADVSDLKNIKLSANWMAACGAPGEDAALYETVKAVAMEFCPLLDIAIPVGKDSMSMRTTWKDSKGQEQKVTSPLSLLITAFAPVDDVRKTLTPEIKKNKGNLYLIHLNDQHRLGASALAQVYNQTGISTPDVDEPLLFKGLLLALIEIKAKNLVHAYHDRSDGGLITTLLEMAFPTRSGLKIFTSTANTIAELFAEEIGVVVQAQDDDVDKINAILAQHKLPSLQLVAKPDANKVTITNFDGLRLYESSITNLKTIWSETSYLMQLHRDNPECAKQEFGLHDDPNHGGLQMDYQFTLNAPNINKGAKPKMAILREQGVNGHIEMAAAFHQAGFQTFDVTMSDLLNKNKNINDFKGFVACGGFSYGDVLGAGSGWAKTILFNPTLKDSFQTFFEKKDSFSLGICNGCQMLSQLKDLIPGAQEWPRFVRNLSEQFEARLVNVKIKSSSSILFKDMQNAILPIANAHGEGRVFYYQEDDKDTLTNNNQVCLQYVDSKGQPTEVYPLNPNGSINGLTGFTSKDGRSTIMMPHPERLFRRVQYSWTKQTEGEYAPWFKLFLNARAFCD